MSPSPAHTSLPHPPTDAGWLARLELLLRAEAGRTRVVRRRHRGPLLVQRPFFPEGPVCHLYLVHPPGGIVSGDHLQLDLQAVDGAHALVTTPAATKFYRARDDEPARLEQMLRVRDAALEWLPQETLVFSGAHARSRTRVDLAGDSRFIGWEVCCLGRPASDESFTHGSVVQDFELWRDGRPLLVDALRLKPGRALSSSWGLAGATALGSLLAWPCGTGELQAVRELQDGHLACTLVDDVLLVRATGAQAEPLRRRLQQAWTRLRPRLLGRQSLPPRIWAT